MLPTHRLLGALLLALPTAAGAAGAPELASFEPVFHQASLAKQQAILGGGSRLQAIAAQQGGQALAASPAASFESTEPLSSVAVQFSPRAAEGASGRPDVFGSVALNVNATPLDSQWHRVKASISNVRKGERLTRELAGDSRGAQVEAVNQWVNQRIAFRDDSRTFGSPDRWATLAETLARGTGDCEDYAIAKMQLLRALGFSADDLYLTVVKDLVRRADHAVLLVRVDGRLFVLDSNTDRVLESHEVADYRPILTFTANGTWIHGYEREIQYADASSGPSVRAAR